MEFYILKNDKEIFDINNIDPGDSKYKTEEYSNLDEFLKKNSGLNFLNEEVEQKLEAFFESEKQDNQYSLERYDIKHWVSNRSFGELIDMYESGEIIRPDMQRNFVWDSIKCSRLIESIIIGLPIPPFFLLEVGKNRYELIDGFQRLTSLVNYVKGRPWNYVFESNKRTIAARLSGEVSKEINGKTFDMLSEDYKRIIKRSTIPLIEFRQITPDNYDSKYLIFERINTGSEKLTPMQIRKALANGSFLNEVYDFSNELPILKKLFSVASMKKDTHVEAVIRILAMYEIYKGTYMPKKEGIKNILNEYCTHKRNSYLDDETRQLFIRSMNNAKLIFDSKYENMFRRVEKNPAGQYEFKGSLNISIFESFISTLMISDSDVDPVTIINSYKSTICKMFEDSSNKLEDNPFSTSTGTLKSIDKRKNTMSTILI